MARLIDADFLYDKVESRYRVSSGIEHRCERDFLDLICAAPTIDPESLRPTREQVEKVWKGEWINKHSAYDHKIFTCAQCGKQISIQGENLDFCPKCGVTQTDEAVQIVMEKLEALHENP